jgi:hypothetical protein
MADQDEQEPNLRWRLAASAILLVFGASPLALILVDEPLQPIYMVVPILAVVALVLLWTLDSLLNKRNAWMERLAGERQAPLPIPDIHRPIRNVVADALDPVEEVREVEYLEDEAQTDEDLDALDELEAVDDDEVEAAPEPAPTIPRLYQETVEADSIDVEPADAEELEELDELESIEDSEKDE